MASILSLSNNYLPALSPAHPNTPKPISTVPVLLSVRYFNRPAGLVSHAGRGHRVALVEAYRGGRGFDLDDELMFSDEEEEEMVQPELDPNFDLDRINSSTVRLLDEQNNMIGVLPIREAIRRADNTGLILMIVSADADPPVLRLFEEGNYKKYMFEKQKKDRNKQRKQGTRTKEVKLGYNIDGHDYSVRLKQATKFLKEGRKVKVMVTLRGREYEYRDQAIDLLRQLQNDLGELASEESKNFIEKTLYIVLMPNKATIQREQQLKQREEELKKKQTVTNEVEQPKMQEGETGITADESSTNVQIEQQDKDASATTEEVSVNV